MKKLKLNSISSSDINICFSFPPNIETIKKLRKIFPGLYEFDEEYIVTRGMKFTYENISKYAGEDHKTKEYEAHISVEKKAIIVILTKTLKYEKIVDKIMKLFEMPLPIGHSNNKK